jgi:hypothetical protein
LVRNIAKLSTPSVLQLAEQYAEVLQLREQLQRFGSRQTTDRGPIRQCSIIPRVHSPENSD